MENNNQFWNEVLTMVPIVVQMVYFALILFAYYCAYNLYRKLCKYLDSHTKED